MGEIKNEIKNEIKKKIRKIFSKKQTWIFVLLIIALIVMAIISRNQNESGSGQTFFDFSPTEIQTVSYSLNDIPEYNGDPYVYINNNQPFFEEKDYTTSSFEYYSDLDSLGRCQTAYANISKKIMPTEAREDIGSVHPSGWHSGNDPAQWNRCHLIGYQLAGENANKKNLITGTRYFNVTGMLPFENEAAEYITKTNNHLLYRVTPIYKGNDLVARGVLMEAYSVEDNGTGVQFCIFVYNIQPGATIDYKTGESFYK